MNSSLLCCSIQTIGSLEHPKHFCWLIVHPVHTTAFQARSTDGVLYFRMYACMYAVCMHVHKFINKIQSYPSYSEMHSCAITRISVLTWPSNACFPPLCWWILTTWSDCDVPIEAVCRCYTIDGRRFISISTSWGASGVRLHGIIVQSDNNKSRITSKFTINNIFSPFKSGKSLITTWFTVNCLFSPSNIGLHYMARPHPSCLLEA